jgi:hypothetical protein
MTAPRVSIVTPFWNAEKFLDEAVASVFAQTWSDWELFLVDDGSTDGGSDRARRLAAEHPDRVRYLEHPGRVNRGISASLNLGISRSGGEYVAILDADDVWLPEKLAKQVVILDAHPAAAMVYGRSQYWYSWNGRLDDRARDHLVKLGVPADAVIEPPELLKRMLGGSAPVPCPSSVLLRRAAVERVGGFEERFHSNHTDQAFFAKLLLTEPVFASSSCWDRYRKHGDSSIAKLRQSGKAAEGRRTYLQWLRDYLRVKGQANGVVGRAVEAELGPLEHPLRARLARAARHPGRSAAAAIERTSSKLLPAFAHRVTRRALAVMRVSRPPGLVRFGDLRRLSPLSRRWGYDRGLPVDRHYIEGFVGRHAADIRGNVLEIGDDSLTWRFGREAVTRADVLNVKAGDPKTTFVGDLADGRSLPSERFDCIVFTETLHLLYDFQAGLRTLHRILKPGGVLLTTFPGITKVARPDDWGDSWYWSFTELAARRFFGETFPGASVEFETWGNVLSATAFLWGLAAEELKPEELEFRDPEYPVTITVRAMKAAGGR